MLRRIFLIAGLLTAMPIQAQQAFRPGDPVRDINPTPVKQMCWDTGSSTYIPCPASGGGTGSSGGPATIANGADVAQGNTADNASTVTDTTPATLIALTKGHTALLSAIKNALGSPLQAGGLIGNTVFGATQSGAWNISNITGTITLPTGAARATDVQAVVTALGSPLQTGGSVIATGNVAGAAADSGNPLKIGCVYNTLPPTYAAGNRTDCQTDTRGSIRMLIGNPNSAASASVATGLTDGLTNSSISGLQVFSFNAVSNGTNWYATRGDVNGTFTVPTPTSAATNSLAGVTNAGATANTLKGSAGNVYSLNIVNSTAAGFAVLYDAAAAPGSGTALTAASVRWCFPIAASAGVDKVFQMPMQMTAGAQLLLSTSCTTYTAVSTPPIIMSGQVK